MSKKTATRLAKDHIYNDLCIGATQKNLVSKLMNDDYGIGIKYKDHAARDLIALVRREIREDFEEEKKELKETMVQRLLFLYNESLEIGNHANALNSLKELGKVCGLYEPMNYNVNLNGGLTVDFGFNSDE